jgi:hypothetical protein
MKWAMPWPRQVITGLSPQRSGFSPRVVHVAFVVAKVALGKAFVPVFQFPPVSVIPPVLQMNLSVIGTVQP